MQRSESRILTSHAGSIYRPESLQEAIASLTPGHGFDTALSNQVREAVAAVVRQQVETGIDVVNDGEYPKQSWSAYIRGRLLGIEQRSSRPGETNPAGITTRESRMFPDYFAARGRMVASFGQSAIFCSGPLKYLGQAETERDIGYLRAGLASVKAEEGFISAISPGSAEHYIHNEYYKTQEEFLYAIADALHEEYSLIVDAGLILQLDDPGLADGFGINADMSIQEYRKYAELRVEASNHALRGIPEDRVRLHVCWGSVHHPHTQDIPLKDIIDLLFRVKAQCYSVEQANPMHEHEWEVFQDFKLPEGKIIMPGVVGHYAPEFVEHPELIAQRLIRYANLVGRENVIAGTDCGLSRVAHASIQWSKFRAMAYGAQIATAKLWGRDELFTAGPPHGYP